MRRAIIVIISFTILSISIFANANEKIAGGCLALDKSEYGLNSYALHDFAGIDLNSRIDQILLVVDDLIGMGMRLSLVTAGFTASELCKPLIRAHKEAVSSLRELYGNNFAKVSATEAYRESAVFKTYADQVIAEGGTLENAYQSAYLFAFENEVARKEFLIRQFHLPGNQEAAAVEQAVIQ